MPIELCTRTLLLGSMSVSNEGRKTCYHGDCYHGDCYYVKLAVRNNRGLMLLMATVSACE